MNPEELLALGLTKGFGGDTNILPSKRAGFSITSSHFEDHQTGALYHDEWAANRVGGGQELVQVGEEQFTRVYAGGTIRLEALSQLKITKEDIMKFLILMINTLGEKTRLNFDVACITQDAWSYQYEVKEQVPGIPLTVGKESIFYRDQLVFVHWFLLCPVE